MLAEQIRRAVEFTIRCKFTHDVSSREFPFARGRILRKTSRLELADDDTLDQDDRTQLHERTQGCVRETCKRNATKTERIHEPYDTILPTQTPEKSDKHFESVVFIVERVELLAPVLHPCVGQQVISNGVLLHDAQNHNPWYPSNKLAHENDWKRNHET